MHNSTFIIGFNKIFLPKLSKPTRIFPIPMPKWLLYFINPHLKRGEKLEKEQVRGYEGGRISSSTMTRICHLRNQEGEVHSHHPPKLQTIILVSRPRTHIKQFASRRVTALEL